MNREVLRGNPLLKKGRIHGVAARAKPSPWNKNPGKGEKKENSSGEKREKRPVMCRSTLFGGRREKKTTFRVGYQDGKNQREGCR